MGNEATPQGGASGASNSATAQPATGAGGQGQGGGTTSAQPSVYDLSDDQLVRINGAKDPVKWGDHYRGFQAEFTRSKQAQARLNAEVTKLKQQLAQNESQQRSQQQAQQPKPGADLLAKVRALQYLSGEDAATAFEHILGQIEGVKNQDLAKRDMALALIYKRLQAAEAALQHSTGRATQSDFDAKITKWVSDAGFDKDAEQFAREMYLAYEPSPELDQQFPTMLKERLETMERLTRKREQAVVQQRRQLPFVPGKGGNGAAGGPLQDLKRAGSKEVADKLWALVDGGSET